MLLPLLYYLILFLLGAAVGSFTSVVIYRLHSKKKGIFRGRSTCRECEVELKPLDLIPIISYLTLRGKCRYCSKEISYMYPLLEIVTGGLFVLFFLKFPFLNSSIQFSGTLFSLYLLHAFYAFVLVFTFFFDLHYLKVSDEILLPAILIGLIATLGTSSTASIPHFFDALLGAAIPLAFFSLQILLSRGKWLGTGDLRVGAFIGVVLGWKMVIVALVFSYLIGSLVSIAVAVKKNKFLGVKIPFAPMLVTGTLITIFFGEEIMGWYLKSLGF